MEIGVEQRKIHNGEQDKEQGMRQGSILKARAAFKHLDTYYRRGSWLKVYTLGVRNMATGKKDSWENWYEPFVSWLLRYLGGKVLRGSCQAVFLPDNRKHRMQQFTLHVAAPDSSALGLNHKRVYGK